MPSLTFIAVFVDIPNGNHEIDFVVQRENDLVALEVKMAIVQTTIRHLLFHLDLYDCLFPAFLDRDLRCALRDCCHPAGLVHRDNFP